MHRAHLGAKMRDAGLEVSLFRGALPQATSASLAAQLLGKFTSPTQAAARSSSGRNPVERLAEEFLDRQRRGERPVLSEYTERFPEWAEEIRELCPNTLNNKNPKNQE